MADHNMKGTSLEKLTEITNFVQKHHKFAKWKNEEEVQESIDAGIAPDLARHGFNIKYVRMDYDTRFGDVWGITFDHIRFATNMFVSVNVLADVEHPLTNKYKTLDEFCFAYLKGELKDYDLKEFEIKR